MGAGGLMAQQCVNFHTALMLLQGKSKRPGGDAVAWRSHLHLNKAATDV